MNNRHLITMEEFHELARPTSTHLDEDEVMIYVNEAEQLHIIPAIGYATYKRLMGRGVMLDDSDNVLLYGGEWQGNAGTCACGDNGLHYCNGLKAATAYFAYAKMAKADGAIMARAGAVRHDDQYYRHEDDKIRQYDDIMDVAEAYLASCLAYMKSLNCNVQPVHGTRCRIKAIGD